jgi:hypothetical protein
MSQRNSTYARKLNDFYATPRWVTDALHRDRRMADRSARVFVAA